ncbi:zinc finger, CCHC-type containing protein, partial [Tanacetum coccineum]
MGNNTWVLADLPPGCKPLGCKWIFKRKLKVDGTIENFKERLVIQGFRQKSGIDYFDTYALVARISTIRLLIAMASIHNLIIYQMDVKTAFLNGELEEEPGIAFVVGKLSRYTSNPGTQHWQAIQRVLKYLKKTMDYRLTYIGYPSVLEGYTDSDGFSLVLPEEQAEGYHQGVIHLRKYPQRVNSSVGCLNLQW